MRYTFGQYRQAARDPSYRVRPGRGGGPNTAGTLRAAVRAFHQEGFGAAVLALDAGLANYFAKPENRAQAQRARAMFSEYVRLADGDGRTAFSYDVAGDLVVAGDVLAVSVDLALLDPSGYAGRIVLWDKLPCDRDAAAMIAAPAMALLTSELDSERVDNIEIWYMRGRLRFPFARDEALARFASVARLLERIRPADDVT